MSFAASIFKPGTRLMHRLQLRYKLWGMIVLIIVPVAIALTAMSREALDEHWKTQRKLAGVEVNRHVYALLAESAARRDGAGHANEIDGRVREREDPSLTAAWESLQAWVAALKANAGPPHRRDSEGLMRAAWRMTIASGNAFGLLFEQSPVDFLAVDMVHERMMRWLAAIERLQVTLHEDAGDKDALAAQQVALAAVVEEAMAMSRAYDEYGGRPMPSFAAAVDASREIAALPPTQIQPLQVESLEALVFGAHADMNEQLERRLEARAAAAATRLAIDAGFGGLALLLITYAMLCLMRAMRESVLSLRHIIECVSDGELRYTKGVPGVDVISSLGQTLDEMTEDLSVRVGKIRSEAVRVAMAGEYIARANRDLLNRTEQSVASLAQTSASVHNLDQTVSESAAASRAAQELVSHLRDVAESSSGTMDEAVSTMQALQVDAGKMVEIIGAIDGIAFQTNILALNASVEAARAGEAGRGFAVVASEVRSLAQRCADSAQQVRDLIERSNSRVEMGVVGIDAVSQALGEILEGMREATHKVFTIAESTSSQSQSLHEISAAVAQLDSITHQNATMVDETVRAADMLNERSAGLTAAVGGMHLRRGTADEAYEMLMRARKYFEDHGFAAARTAMHDQAGEFRDRDLYVFAFDRSRMFEIYGADPTKAGHTTVDELPGLDGEHLYNAGWAAAERGGDWIEYDVRNPVSGRIEPKISYIVPAGEYVMGCGVYKPIPRHEREAAERARRAALAARALATAGEAGD